MKFVNLCSDDANNVCKLFMFPNTIDHDRFLENIVYYAYNVDDNFWEPISAGFINKKRCYGRSESLDMDSHPETDTELYLQQLEQTMKYIVANMAGDDNELIFTFPNSITHIDFFENLCHMRIGSDRNWERVPWTIISAGFMSSSHTCYGRSESLNIDSRLEVDTKLFESGFWS